MISKKEEERNEKIIRGLMKLPPNRRCINCDSLGPQYVCTNFWTFVCTTCSGIHREFTHRVKSVSMSKFTTQEVDALQKGGNQRAREQFLREWETHQMRLPNNSKPEKVREFIKNVYVDKKYYRSTTSDKPPRDTLGEDDYRKASSYHSFSQSPPYDHQYEERRYGKQAGMLSRKPGSERGVEGKIFSFLYSPGRQSGQKFENKFVNESAGSRVSDYSVSNDPLRSDGQSPDFYVQRIRPPLQSEDAKVQNMEVAPKLVAKEDSNKRSVLPSGSIGTSDSNSQLLKSTESGSLIDSILEAAPASTSDAANTGLLNHMPIQTQNTFSDPFIDLFADINQMPPVISPVEEKPPAIPATNNEGWAFFDLHHSLEPATQSTNIPSSIIKDAPKETIDLFSSIHSLEPATQSTNIPSSIIKDAPKETIDSFSSIHSNFDWFSAQTSDSSGQSSLSTDQWPGLNGAKNSVSTGNTQLWNTLSNPIGSITQSLPAVLLDNNESHDMLHCPPSYVDPCIGFKAPEAKLNDGYLIPSVDVKAPAASAAAAAAGMTNSFSLPPSIPQTGGVPSERKASSNPFDLEPEVNNMMPAFSDSLSNTWFQQDSLSSFLPPMPQGSLAYTGGQLPSQYPQNLGSQGSIPPLGGNPFV